MRNCRPAHYLIIALIMAVAGGIGGCRGKSAPDKPDGQTIAPSRAGPLADAAAKPKVTETCVPVCAGRDCGEDGCGGSCGPCPGKFFCDESGQCQEPACEPECQDRECGPDGCKGTCGVCEARLQCNDQGRCELPPCGPDCIGKECGDDGCGGTCGVCPPNSQCQGFKCTSGPCKPDCVGRVCGDDGCGGSCGGCNLPDTCSHGRCVRQLAFGAFVGYGKEPWRKDPEGLGAFSHKLGKQLAIAHTYVPFPADWSGECKFGEFPKEWAEEVLAVNPVGAIMITLMPQCGFNLFVEDFGPGSAAYKATAALAQAAKKFPGPVFLRFAHAMNTPWYSWGTCYFENVDNRNGCIKDPATYRDGFVNFSVTAHEHGGDNVRTVWAVREWEPYWAEHHKDYPAYDAFYPGDEVVDWVGLDLYFQDSDPPRPGEFSRRINGLYEQYASAHNHNKPMMVSETAAECVVREELEIYRRIGDFDSKRSWWGAWGNLAVKTARPAAPARVSRMKTGDRHIVLEAKAGDNGPHECSTFYVGGTAFTVEWEKGKSFVKGNVMLFMGKKGPDGGSPTLKIELCDVNAPECPKDDPCCEKGTVAADIEVSSTDWQPYVIPLSEFKPTEKGAKPSIDWKAIRAIKVHLLCSQPTDNLASLHLDGMAVGTWNRGGGSRCTHVANQWAAQVFAPGQCYEWPNLKAILWFHDRIEKKDATRDYRIPDFHAFSKLLKDRCFGGGFF